MCTHWQSRIVDSVELQLRDVWEYLHERDDQSYVSRFDASFHDAQNF